MKRVIAFLLSAVLACSVTVQDVSAFDESMITEESALAEEQITEEQPQDAGDLPDEFDAADAIETAEAVDEADAADATETAEAAEEADATEEELLTDESKESEMPDYSELCGYIRDPNRPLVESMSVHAADQDENEERLGAGNLPSFYKTAEHQNLPSLRSQTGGTCWAHAAIACAEIDMIKKGLADQPDWSEYQLAYFRFYRPVDPLGGTLGETIIKEGEDIFGGFDNLFAANTLASWVGVSETTEELEPEVLRENGADPSLAYRDIVHLSDFYAVALHSEEDRDAVKQIIMDHGAVACAYRSADLDQNYNSKYNAYYNPFKTSSNHAVTVVGWDDDFPKEYFNETPEGNGAWLIRNSWWDKEYSPEYSYYGYFWLSYYDKGLEQEFFGYDYDTADNYDNNYQYDGAAANFIYETARDDIASMANVFRAHASPRGETLRAASFYTDKSNLDYEVSAFTDLADPADPESGICIATESGSISYPGYYTIPFASPEHLEFGDTYSIVVRLKKTGEHFQLIREGGFSNGDFLMGAGSGTGQSFWLDESGQWIDVGADGRGNIRVKAFTDNDEGGSDSTYDVIFHANHQTNEYVTQSLGVSDHAELRTNTFLREGYSFAGWNTRSDGSGIAYADRERVSGLCANGERVHLYAQWTPNDYTVTLHANGGTCGTKSIQVTYGQKYSDLPGKKDIELPAMYENERVMFSGWYTDLTGGTRVENIDTVTKAENQDLYARWSISLALDANGGNYPGPYDVIVVRSYISVVINSQIGHLLDFNPPVRDGYQFAGWYDAQTGGTRIKSTDVITGLDLRTVYAHWTTADTYTVKLLPNGGRVLEPTATVTYGENYGDLPKPFRTGYYFAGWYTEKTGGVKIDSETIVSVDNFDLSASEHNLYARWIPCRYKVIFNGNGGSISSKFKYVTFGEK